MLFHKTSTGWKMSMEDSWNDTDMRQQKYSEENLSQYHFLYYKSYKDWPGIEPGDHRWQARNISANIGVTWLITLGGGGGQNRPWVLGTLIYERDKFERGEDWFEPVLHVHTLLSPTLTQFFYLPLFNSVAKKKLFLGIKNVGGTFVTPCPSPSYPLCANK
jgi:hypothetical protein